MKAILIILFTLTASLRPVDKKYFVCHVEVEYPGVSTCHLKLIEAENRESAKRIFNDGVIKSKKGVDWVFSTYAVIESTYWMENNKTK